MKETLCPPTRQEQKKGRGPSPVLTVQPPPRKARLWFRRRVRARGVVGVVPPVKVAGRADEVVVGYGLGGRERARGSTGGETRLETRWRDVRRGVGVGTRPSETGDEVTVV